MQRCGKCGRSRERRGRRRGRPGQGPTGRAPSRTAGAWPSASPASLRGSGSADPAPALGCLCSYLVLVGSAVRFGELVNAIYHVHRGLLYDALGYPRPENKESERDAGIALAQALLRG